MADSVTVGVRIRPLNRRELSSRNSGVAWSSTETSISRLDTPTNSSAPLTSKSSSSSSSRSPSRRNSTSANASGQTFRYDAVFDKRSTNEHVYTSLAAPVVDAALGGFNATIFAYGQTSSGKTHSMMGSKEDPGITPRAIRHIIDAARNSRTRDFLLRAVYVEIYNDKIRDLLNPAAGDLAVREDKAGRTFVDAHETLVESFEDAMEVLRKGDEVRQVGETNMNARSSRSHAVFTLHVESKNREGLDASFHAASLNLVDLAGSERLKSTGAVGQRAREGAHINQSLVVLGTIINRLSAAGTDASKIGHLPYRDSKLTRLLRPALGGNARTAILCAVTPSAEHVEETVSTLRFAERAKKVTTNATRNEVIDYRAKYKEASTEVAVLKERFLAMEQELAELRANRESAGSKFGQVGEEEEDGVSEMTASSSTASSATSVTASSAGAHAAAVPPSPLAQVVDVTANASGDGDRSQSVEEGAQVCLDNVVKSDDALHPSTEEDTSPVTQITATTPPPTTSAIPPRPPSPAPPSNSTTTKTTISTTTDHRAAAEAETQREIKLRKAVDDVKFLRAHVDEVESENEDLKERLKLKAAEFGRLRARAVELRTAARQARAREKALQQVVRNCYGRLEEARRQLEASRKKGAHVRVAESQLEELSRALRRQTRGVVEGDDGESRVLGEGEGTVAKTPVQGSAAAAAAELAKRFGGGGAGAAGMTVLTGGKGGTSGSLGVVEGLRGGEDVGDGFSTWGPGGYARRRPRPLPEDMVADIDVWEEEQGVGSGNNSRDGSMGRKVSFGAEVAETGGDGDRDGDGDDGGSGGMNELVRRDSLFNEDAVEIAEEEGEEGEEEEKRRKEAEEAAVARKKKSKSKWKALRSFYGYTDGVYDKMMGGHKLQTRASGEGECGGGDGGGGGGGGGGGAEVR